MLTRFRSKIAIDLGTAQVLVSTPGKGIILQEPSVVAYDSYTEKIVAVGKEAKKMLGRTPANLKAKKPMKDGVIADFNATEKMIEYFINRAIGKSLFKPIFLICVPSQITQVQRRAVIQASRYAGGHETYLIEESLAAALGAGIDVSNSKGTMICDVGGGTTDIAIISSGSIVKSKSLPIAGDSLDTAISEYIRRKYHMMIGETTAEIIKIRLASCFPGDTDTLHEVKGRNLMTGLPMHIYITSTDIYHATRQPIERIVEEIKNVLESTPAELAADLFETGIVLTGGGALIRGLDRKIHEETKLEVQIPEKPMTCAIRGTNRAMMHLDSMDASELGELEARRKVLEQMVREF